MMCALASASAHMRTTDTPAVSFRSQAQYVLVPVVVTDSNGRPVSGLTKDDFSVFEQGEQQTIASFQLIEATPARTTEAPRTRRVNSVSNRVVDGAQQSLTIIALDQINTRPEKQVDAVDALIKFLANGYDGSPVELLLLRSNGVFVLHRLSDDPSRLLEAARKLLARRHETQSIDDSRQWAMFIGAALAASGISPELHPYFVSLQEHEKQIEGGAVDLTSDALEYIARSVSGVVGRKSLIWLTSSFPISALDPGKMGDKDKFTRALHALGTANVAVYPIDVRGLEGWGRYSWVERGPVPDREKERVSKLNAMKTVAAATGGRALYDSNDLSQQIRAAQQDGSTYYLLSYRRPDVKRASGWRNLRVEVARRGLKVRSRTGYFFDSRPIDAESARKQELELALTSPLDYTGLPVSVEWTTHPTGAGTKVTFEMTVPGDEFKAADLSSGLDFDFAFVASTMGGKEVASRVQKYKLRITETGASQLRNGLTYKNEFTVPPGTYDVRFVVRDNTRSLTGSASAVLDVSQPKEKGD